MTPEDMTERDRQSTGLVLVALLLLVLLVALVLYACPVSITP